MKKMFSVFIAVVLVFAMSVPAFAVSALDESGNFTSIDTFIADTVFSLSGVKFTAEQIEYLSDWVNSDNSVLYCYKKGKSYILTFLNVSLSSSFTYSGGMLLNSDFYDVLGVDTLSFVVRGVSHFPSSQVVSYEVGGSAFFASGSYFANSSVILGDDIKAIISNDKFTIEDDYGIFDGWISSYDPPPMRYEISIDYAYSDGTQAALPVSGKYFVGDTFNISSPVIDGYTPDIPTVSGTVLDDFSPVTDYHVVYRETPCKLTVNYSHEDGAQAAPPFIGHFEKGERYNISSPYLAGYLPNYPVISGTVSTSNSPDLVFDVVYRVDRSVIVSGDFEPLTKGLLETVSIVFMVCCSLYAFVLSIKCVVELLRSMTR